ncbi:MAG: hypothetical protein WCV91_06120, partial [Candidatus Margulisiibacteriota bacterium]
MRKVIFSALIAIICCSVLSMGSFAAAKKSAKKPVPANKNVVNPGIKLDDVKISVVEKPENKYWSLKGGYAGGGALLAGTISVPFKGLYVGGEAGYVIGSGFGVMDLGINCIYPMGDRYVGVEATYANYSKNVGNIPGISGSKNGAQ